VLQQFSINRGISGRMGGVLQRSEKTPITLKSNSMERRWESSTESCINQSKGTKANDKSSY